jgi:hypothetical protein
MASTRSQAGLRPSPKTAFVSRMRPNDTRKSREVYPLHHDGGLTDAAEQKVWSSLSRLPAWTRRRSGVLSCRLQTVPKTPDSWSAVGAAGKGAKRPARPLRAGTAAGRSYPFFLPNFSSEVLAPWFADRTKETRPKRGLIRLHSALNEFVGPAGAPWRSHSSSLDHRRRPEILRTAIATAFFWPTMTTSRLPRVTPV